LEEDGEGDEEITLKGGVADEEGEEMTGKKLEMTEDFFVLHPRKRWKVFFEVGVD
jgi:hypothetical protein